MQHILRTGFLSVAILTAFSPAAAQQVQPGWPKTQSDFAELSRCHTVIAIVSGTSAGTETVKRVELRMREKVVAAHMSKQITDQMMKSDSEYVEAVRADKDRLTNDFRSCMARGVYQAP